MIPSRSINFLCAGRKRRSIKRCIRIRHNGSTIDFEIKVDITPVSKRNKTRTWILQVIPTVPLLLQFSVLNDAILSFSWTKISLLFIFSSDWLVPPGTAGVRTLWQRQMLRFKRRSWRRDFGWNFYRYSILHRFHPPLDFWRYACRRRWRLRALHVCLLCSHLLRYSNRRVFRLVFKLLCGLVFPHSRVFLRFEAYICHRWLGIEAHRAWQYLCCHHIQQNSAVLTQVALDWFVLGVASIVIDRTFDSIFITAKAFVICDTVGGRMLPPFLTTCTEQW